MQVPVRLVDGKADGGLLVGLLATILVNPFQGVILFVIGVALHIGDHSRIRSGPPVRQEAHPKAGRRCGGFRRNGVISVPVGKDFRPCHGKGPCSVLGRSAGGDPDRLRSRRYDPEVQVDITSTFTGPRCISVAQVRLHGELGNILQCSPIGEFLVSGQKPMDAVRRRNRHQAAQTSAEGQFLSEGPWIVDQPPGDAFRHIRRNADGVAAADAQLHSPDLRGRGQGEPGVGPGRRQRQGKHQQKKSRY